MSVHFIHAAIGFIFLGVWAFVGQIVCRGS